MPDRRDRASKRAALCLIGDRAAVGASLTDRLKSLYDLRVAGSREVLGLGEAEREEVVAGVEAVLIDWGEASAAVIFALKAPAAGRDVPLIAVCGPEGAEAEQVAALVVGAHYTLRHPLNPILLQARLRTYRQGNGAAASAAAGDGLPAVAPPAVSMRAMHDVCSVGALTLDRTARCFYVRGRPVTLTGKEFDLMAFLMARVGACVCRDEILDQVWDIDFDTGTNLLDARMYTLRRKLRAHDMGHAIQTVRGVGYRLIDP